ncbi:hypothetical protein [Streptomyces sp. NPDC020298]|uniref:hypothetical protein n=1 Tax=unclassified Streptomyces TaxID=2593676 RepID=UPI0033E089B6
MAALAVVGFGHNNAHEDRPTSPRPGSRGPYPIHYDQLTGNPPQTVLPQPTVSYPIKFKTQKAKPAVPRPTVSYPIDFSTMGGGR